MGERSQSQYGLQRRIRYEPIETRDEDGTHDLGMIARPAKGGLRYPIKDRFGTFGETVTREAIADLVARAKAGTLDTYVFVGHNSQTTPLCATRSGTLTFRQDPINGDLVADMKVDSRSALSTDAYVSCLRGDLAGCSIGFVVDPAGDHWNAQETERTITRFADLPEFSLVTRPASPQASVAIATESAAGRTRRMTTQELREAKRPQHIAWVRDKMRRDLLAIEESRAKTKYSDADRKVLAKQGKAMADGSYPIIDREDLDRAIKMVGLAKPASSVPAVKAHIRARAKALGLSSLIPKGW